MQSKEPASAAQCKAVEYIYMLGTGNTIFVWLISAPASINRITASGQSFPAAYAMTELSD